jgi:hypothetical protein
MLKTPPAIQTIPVNIGVITYEFKDSESNPVSLNINDETNSGQPPYITTNNSFIIIRATSFESLGTHTVRVNLSDGNLSKDY